MLKVCSLIEITENSCVEMQDCLTVRVSIVCETWLGREFTHELWSLEEEMSENCKNKKKYKLQISISKVAYLCKYTSSTKKRLLWLIILLIVMFKRPLTGPGEVRFKCCAASQFGDWVKRHFGES